VTKLDRNLNADGCGKYGLILNRRLAQIRENSGGDGALCLRDRDEVMKAIDLLEKVGIIDWGTTPDAEFFVIRLKDVHAAAALAAYAEDAAALGDFEFAREVVELADKADDHPNRKRPD
jgi:hypothetical protein